jgi:hypothetical protein
MTKDNSVVYGENLKNKYEIQKELEIIEENLTKKNQIQSFTRLTNYV